MKVVVISPHPDDDVIGMGGTMAKLVSEGHRVSSVYVTNGAKSPRSFEMPDEKMARVRRKEARDASLGVLGVSRTYFLQPTQVTRGGIEEADAPGIKRKLKRVLLKEQPDEIYIPHSEESHPTHQRSARMLLELLGEIESLSPTLWGYEVWTPIQKPSFFVDITCFTGKKRQAIEAHRTQLRDKRYDEGILGLNRYRAVFLDPYQVEDAQYVEAFAKLR